MAEYSAALTAVHDDIAVAQTPTAPGAALTAKVLPPRYWDFVKTLTVVVASLFSAAPFSSLPCLSFVSCFATFSAAPLFSLSFVLS